LGSIAASILCLSGAAYLCSVALAAFHAGHGTVSSLLLAARITPGDAEPWQQAGLKLLATDSSQARICLNRAVHLNPRAADALLGLAFLSEASGSARAAEQHYLAAVAVSKRFKPSYALTAFYFREDRMPLFWTWAARTAAIDAADPAMLFQLAHMASSSPPLKLESQHALTAYLLFLLREGNLENVAETALKIDLTKANLDLFLTACERLLDDGKVADAAKIWNRLGPYGAAFTHLDPLNGSAAANGSFLPAPMRAFNWRSNRTPEIIVSMLEPSGLSVVLSGRQPESGTILNLPLLLLPGRAYQLRFRADVTGLASTNGLQWAVVAGKQIRHRGDWINNSPEGTFAFIAPAESAHLVLRYERIPGTLRLRGLLILRAAELRAIP
jgi:hypothetical protein